MSWSFDATGTPPEVCSKLAVAIDQHSGVSRREIEEAVPHIQGLVKTITGDRSVVRVQANGYGSWVDDRKVSSLTQVHITSLYQEPPAPEPVPDVPLESTAVVPVEPAAVVGQAVEPPPEPPVEPPVESVVPAKKPAKKAKTAKKRR